MFSIKGQRVNIFDFVGHTVPISTTQLCHRSTKAPMVNTKTEEHVCSSKTLLTDAEV